MTLSPPIRILAIVGVLAAIAAGVLLVTKSRSDSGGSTATPSVASQTSQSTSSSTTATPSTANVAPKPAAKPKVQLVSGLPAPINHALQNSKVVVAVLYAHGVDADQATVAAARAGAKAARSGFAVVDVVNEKQALRLSSFAGATIAPPAVLVVKRPGKIVNQLGGVVDSTVVAQAALGAGAGK